MEKSQSIKELAKALISFHLKVDTISKDTTNPFFKSKYASLSNILDAINTPLIESGLAFSQCPSGENELITILMHADSGEFLQSAYTMQPIKNDPQGKGSVITYQRRYALSAILGLNIDEDDDGNAASKSDNKRDIKKPGLNKSTGNNIDEDVLSQWAAGVKGCATIADLTALYETNKGIINSEPQIFELFGKRKKELTAKK